MNIHRWVYLTLKKIIVTCRKVSYGKDKHYNNYSSETGIEAAS